MHRRGILTAYDAFGDEMLPATPPPAYRSTFLPPIEESTDELEDSGCATTKAAPTITLSPPTPEASAHRPQEPITLTRDSSPSSSRYTNVSWPQSDNKTQLDPSDIQTWLANTRTGPYKYHPALCTLSQPTQAHPALPQPDPAYLLGRRQQDQTPPAVETYRTLRISLEETTTAPTLTPRELENCSPPQPARLSLTKTQSLRSLSGFTPSPLRRSVVELQQPLLSNSMGLKGPVNWKWQFRACLWVLIIMTIVALGSVALMAAGGAPVVEAGDWWGRG